MTSQALLTEVADYDEPGSWGRASNGWPEIKGKQAKDMYVFANCVRSIPYGSYVLMSEKGRYEATETCLRVSPDHVRQLRRDFNTAGRPDQEVSVKRREHYGRPNQFGNKMAVPVWTA